MMDNLGHLCTYQVAPTTSRLYKEKFVWLFVAGWLKTLLLCHGYTYSIVFFICICYYIKLIISMIHIVFHPLLPRVERFTNKWAILDVYNANLEKGIQLVKLNDFDWTTPQVKFWKKSFEKKSKEITSRVVRRLLYFGCIIHQMHIKKKNLNLSQ